MKQVGFSLMELIIVIVIIGILIGAMVPLLVKNTDKAKIAKAQADLDAIREAALLYRVDTGKWPGRHIDAPSGSYYYEQNKDESGLVTNDFNEANWNGPYLNERKNDPWGNPYLIVMEWGKLIVFSYGPNQINESGQNGNLVSGNIADDITVVITSFCYQFNCP